MRKGADALKLRLAAIRKMRGLRQREVAELSGIPHVMIARYETGACTPTIVRVQKLADVLGVKVDDLIEKGE